MSHKTSRRGDRKDAWLVRDIDSMHGIFPYALPNRTANEAVMNENIDLTAIKRYLEKKNADSPEFAYTFFHVICAAIAKVVVLRPKMNRFYSGGHLYERKEISLSFTVKKRFVDESAEALAIIRIDRDSDVSPIEQVYTKVKKIVYSVRRENKTDGTTDVLDSLIKMPAPILKLVFGVLRWMEAHGWYPDSMLRDDPFYTSVFLTNLGSIKMNASYHHLADWGTNSFFCVVGEKKWTPHFEPDGSYEMRETLGLGMTIDERIADGLYFANSLKILRLLLANPELLELPIDRPVSEADISTGGQDDERNKSTVAV